MKINQNQTSVLSLFLIAFFGLLMGHGNVFGYEATVFWIILAGWFYFVRDKAKPKSGDQVPKV